MTNEEFENLELNYFQIVFKENNGILAGPFHSKFQYNGFDIELEQCCVRFMTISSPNYRKLIEFLEISNKLEMFFHLCDGKFVELEKFEAKKDDIIVIDQATFLSYKLSLFSNKNYLKNTYNQLISPFDIFNEISFKKWIEIVNDFGLPYYQFLYQTCDNHMPSDLCVANIIECFESMAEFISENDSSFPKIKNDGSTTLKNCIDVVITKYGLEVFDKELKANKDDFLQILVNSRVRLLHSKRNYQKKYLNGAESCIYIAKISLLFRIILLDFLGINKSVFDSTLKNSIEKYEYYFGTSFNNFIAKL